MRKDWRGAAVAGDAEAVARLLAEGLNVNDRDRYGQTALMLAARHGHLETIRVLLDAGADKDVSAKFGLTALMLAVVNSHDAVAVELVDQGADLWPLGSGAPGFAGKRAYDLAWEAGASELAEYIRRRMLSGSGAMVR